MALCSLRNFHTSLAIAITRPWPAALGISESPQALQLASSHRIRMRLFARLSLERRRHDCSIMVREPRSSGNPLDDAEVTCVRGPPRPGVDSDNFGFSGVVAAEGDGRAAAFCSAWAWPASTQEIGSAGSSAAVQGRTPAVERDRTQSTTAQTPDGGVLKRQAGQRTDPLPGSGHGGKPEACRASVFGDYLGTVHV